MTVYADQVTQNFDEWLKEKAFLGDHEIFDNGDISRFYTGISYRGFNYIYKINESAEDIAPLIEHSVDYFKSRRIPFLLCQNAANSQDNRKDFLKTLELQYAQQSKGLVRSLSDFQPQDNKVPGLTVEMVNHEGLLKSWLTVGSQAYGYGIDEGLALFLPLLREGARTRLFIASLEGKPVGSSALFMGSETAGLYWGGVIPKARNRGINTEMAKARMQFAKEQGYSTAVVQCFETSLGLYKRLGFEEHCAIDFYRYLPE